MALCFQDDALYAGLKARVPTDPSFAIYPTEVDAERYSRQNMRLPKRHLSKHRRARLIAWALAMLLWMASVLFAGAAFTDRHARRRGARMSLERLARMVKLLIVSRAADFARMRRRARYVCFQHGRDLTPRGLIRAVIGARVRRALKRKAIDETIAVLIDALRRLDTHAAIVALRMRRRLTRRTPILAGPAPSPPAAFFAARRAVFADSS